MTSPHPIEARTRALAAPVAIAADERFERAIIGAAVAAGRLPGEPAVILTTGRRRSVLARLFGFRARPPLSDPRLEVVRAISAFLAHGAAPVRRDLLAAADRAGLTAEQLRRAFPGVRAEFFAS